MVDYLYRRNIFHIREMAFTSLCKAKKIKCDIAYIHSNESKLTEESSAPNVLAKKQYTLVNNLLATEEEILANIKKNCKYEIKRAEREGAIVNVYTDFKSLKDNKVIEKFELTYNAMFKAKGLRNVFNKNLVIAAAKNGYLVITTCMTTEEPEYVVFHAYLADGNNTVLMYSASPLWEYGDKDKANLIGRMNKHLHWKDIEWFKNSGYKRYEWGGISNPDLPNGIDKFKMEFGGKQECFYNYIVAHSLLGKLYLYLIRRRENH